MKMKGVMMDVMTEKEAEELNEKLAGAADVVSIIRKWIMDMARGGKTQDRDNIIPFEKRKK